MASCTVDLGGVTAVCPDHGELWSAAFSAEPQPDGSLTLRWDSPRLGYRYEKRFALDGGSLICRYRIENPTDRDLSLPRSGGAGPAPAPAGGGPDRANVFSSALGAAGRRLTYPAAGPGPQPNARRGHLEVLRRRSRV